MNLPILTVEEVFWIKNCAMVLLAIVAGFLGELYRTVMKREQIVWKYVFVKAGAAGFCGVMFLLGCSAASLSDQTTGMVVGVFGWLGAEVSIVVLEKWVFRSIGINKNPPLQERSDDFTDRNNDNP